MFEVSDLVVEITNRCNLNCSFCYANSNTTSNELSVQQIKDAIAKTKPKCIGFAGGDPLMRHDDIVELLPYCKEFVGNDFKGIRIETNGTLPIDFNQFVLDGSTYGIHFNCAFDGLKELHESQRGIGTWDKTVGFVKEAIDRGYWMTTKATMPDDVLLNEVDYLYDFAKFCAEIGLPRIRIGNVKSSGRGLRDDGGDDYAETIAKMRDNVVEVGKRIEKDFNMHITDGKPYVVPAFCGGCGYDRQSLILDWNGVLRMECPFLKVPLCHYTKYTTKIHQLGLSLMKRNKMGMHNNKEFDMTGRKSVFG